MTYDQLIKHYGSGMKAAAELDISLTAINNWKGGINYWSQCAIQTISGGALIANKSHAPKPNKSGSK